MLISLFLLGVFFTGMFFGILLKAVWSSKPQTEMIGGKCECNHWRAAHIDGNGSCAVAVQRPEKPGKPGACACQVYVRQPRTVEEIMKEGEIVAS